MKTKAFGPNKTPIVTIGQGTWQMERNDRQRCITALRRGLDLGLTHIDTAEMYGNGRVEELVGEAISGRREEVFLASKVLPQNASLLGTINACEKSLARLQTDHLDLYMLHWPGSQPLTETIEAFTRLQQQGKIRAWGVSNFDVPDLEKVLAIAGPGKLACNQVLYHLEERAMEHQVLPWCERHQVSVVAYSPFYVGRFPPKGKGGKLLQDIAQQHSQTRPISPQQVALRFLLRHPSLFVIPKSSNPHHTEDNANADQLTLSPEEISRLEAAFPLGPLGRGLPTI